MGTGTAPDLDCAEEAVDHLRRIEHQQQDALLLAHAEPLAERRAQAIDLFVQLAVRDPPIAAFDCDRAGATLLEVPVDEVGGGVHFSTDETCLVSDSSWCQLCDKSSAFCQFIAG